MKDRTTLNHSYLLTLTCFCRPGTKASCRDRPRPSAATKPSRLPTAEMAVRTDAPACVSLHARASLVSVFFVRAFSQGAAASGGEASAAGGGRGSRAQARRTKRFAALGLPDDHAFHLQKRWVSLRHCLLQSLFFSLVLFFVFDNRGFRSAGLSRLPAPEAVGFLGSVFFPLVFFLQTRLSEKRWISLRIPFSFLFYLFSLYMLDGPFVSSALGSGVPG